MIRKKPEENKQSLGRYIWRWPGICLDILDCEVLFHLKKVEFEGSCNLYSALWL